MARSNFGHVVRRDSARFARFPHSSNPSTDSSYTCSLSYASRRVPRNRSSASLAASSREPPLRLAPVTLVQASREARPRGNEGGSPPPPPRWHVHWTRKMTRRRWRVLHGSPLPLSGMPSMQNWTDKASQESTRNARIDARKT